MTNVMFLGGGRRTTLAELFRAEGCRVFGYELDKRVPLAEFGEVVRGVAWSAPDFPRHLADAVRERDVRLVVPLDCRAVEAVSGLPADLGVPAVVSHPDAAAVCLDKRKFEEHCRRVCYPFYPWPEADRRYVIKPAFGCGSRGIERAAFWDEGFRRGADDVVFQRELAGREYSIDAYFDRDSRLVAALPRERLRVAGGEVLESRTVYRQDLVATAAAVARGLRLRGPVCVQVMEPEPRKCHFPAPHFVTEANARFGGGATLSIAAGLDMVKWLLAEYVEGRNLDDDERRPRLNHNLLVTRSFRDAYFEC